jgi:haloalkane dehalogenase
VKRTFDVDPSEYPFKDHWWPYGDGFVHYVDEGRGQVVLLLHGNPTWSYLYRNIIKELRGDYRLVALDYPGFGMSKAPSGYAFTPQEQAQAVEQFIQHLNLTNILLVVQDWGGPIGMSYAVRHKQNVCGIVVMNSWAWPASVPQRLFSLVMGGWPLGYWLQTRRNFFARVIVPRGIHHSEKVTENLKKAYTSPFPTPESRRPTWVFPRQIRKAWSWLRALESQLPILSDVPTKILWGAKDEPGFRLQERVKWQRYLKRHEVEILNDASHFVQEDRPDRVAAAIRQVSDDAGKASSAAVARTPSS